MDLQNIWNFDQDFFFRRYLFWFKGGLLMIFFLNAEYGSENESRGISRDFNFESHVQFLTNDPCTLFFSAMHLSIRRGGM